MGQSELPQRKKLAHVPPVEGIDRPVILFVTLTVQPRGNHLASDLFHAAFVEACRDADAWSVGRYVIMPDHIHLFCVPAKWPPVGIRRWARYLKRRITIRLESATRRDATAREDARPPGGTTETGSELGGRASSRAVVSRFPWRWQSDCWDTQMRNGDQYHEKGLYVRENPVRAGLVADAEKWFFQGELAVLRW